MESERRVRDERENEGREKERMGYIKGARGVFIIVKSFGPKLKNTIL